MARRNDEGLAELIRGEATKPHGKRTSRSRYEFRGRGTSEALLLLLSILSPGFSLAQSDPLSPLFEVDHPAIRDFVSQSSGYGAISEDRSHVAAYFSEGEIQKIKPGAKATVRLAPTGTSPIEVPGSVQSLLKKADPRTGQGIVTIRIPPQAVPAHTYAHAVVEISSRKALSIPTTAIVIDQGKAFVYKRSSEGEFEKTPVEIGEINPKYSEVMKGIHSSDLILTKGAIEWMTKETGDGGEG